MRPFGKLVLTSGSTLRSGSHNDGIHKKSRSNAPSDRRAREDPVSVTQLSTPNGDRLTSDSYFTSTRRKTAFHGDGVCETDDFGFPVAEYTRTPTEMVGTIEPDKPLLKGRCRTCDRQFQVLLGKTAECEQCSTVNIINPAKVDVEYNHTFSLARIQESIHQAIEDGLVKIKERRLRDTSPTRSPISMESFATEDLTLPLPVEEAKIVRRGSAPDAPRPSPASLDVTMTTSARRSVRKNVPGPVALKTLTETRPAKSIGRSPFGYKTPKSLALPIGRAVDHGSPNSSNSISRPRNDHLRDVFRPIFNHLSTTIRRQRLNVAFSSIRVQQRERNNGSRPRKTMTTEPSTRPETPPANISQMEHKDLMIGDVYDVASSLVTDRHSPSKKQHTNNGSRISRLVSQTSPHIDWKTLQQWHESTLGIGTPLRKSFEGGIDGNQSPQMVDEPLRVRVLEDLGFHVRSTTLDLMEQLVLSPQPLPTSPEEIRYLLILLASPLLLTPEKYPVRASRRTQSATLPISSTSINCGSKKAQRISPANVQQQVRNHTRQSRVLSLILGVLSNTPVECHTFITGWLTRYPEDLFRTHVDMLMTFINEQVANLQRVVRNSRHPQKSHTYNGIASSQIFDEMLQSNFVPVHDSVSQDWKLRSACKILQLFVRANDHFVSKTMNTRATEAPVPVSRKKPMVKQLLASTSFYVTQLDSEEKFDPRHDFDDWERKNPGLQLSEFSFLLPLGTKIKILEFDAKRKMEIKARQEFFDSLSRHTAIDRNFHLSVRRKCIVEDSLQRISEALNSSEGEAKKALKVHFDGEDGIDAGGPRKEWFLLLVKELLDPAVGLFLYNEDSNFCYFNPSSFESSEQYQLVGAVLGLAIYNFTILDVPFPPFLFRKLVAAAPQQKGFDPHQGWKPAWKPDLSDLAQYDPMLAKNLQYILDYEGDLAEEVCATFDVETQHHGTYHKISLTKDGLEKIVDKDNREEYVRLYVEHLLDKSIRKQFEAFARGFYNVCAGTAFSLFKGDEVEYLIRGSGDLNFSMLRGTTVYDNWKLDEEMPEIATAEEVEQTFPVIKWFWELMSHADMEDQKRVLRWITGSDRIPATGIGGLKFRIQRLGGDSGHLPQCRTCFNTLQLWNYSSKRAFVTKFWYAVIQSGEGFGLK